ncbi:hypothetical protein LTR78_008256 [Recurvomyces mirabilis]|uniref:AAA+ ATPase domain-containing protein n=1 Tax=Recurvomyces mirabilis TaxID=574656 RepID=A0AAE0TTY8_9PEZI|nr:hypothetical protein LTR78_008256 [Recurvomyces mirabilis]KAK5156541.1 hypothetical protein LTS14_004753 [Recurvomyces mirabilis]
MGQYGTQDQAKDTAAVSASSGLAVLNAFKTHCSGTRTNTELAVLESLRLIHPDKHIAVLSLPHVDLLGFAKAGHAKAHLCTADHSYHITRLYSPPRTRMTSGAGKLDESVDFGLYNYNWQNQDFLLYRIVWPDPFDGTQTFHCLLTDKVEGSSRHSDITDSLIIACGKWTGELHEEIYVFDAGRWIKNEKLWQAVQTSSWDDVILDPLMKDTLIGDVHSFFDSRTVYEEYSVPWKRGIIMHGPPGCGKTISIKALMNSLQAKDVASLYVKSFDACQGLQHSIRNIFSLARTMAPCLLIFEDIDSLVKDEVRSYFLNEVDGLDSNDGILMIGSTNHLEKLDPAIAKRPSRFDRKYCFRLPGHAERVLYCEYWRGKLQRHKDLGFTDEVCDIVASLTEEFSFAYMKELFVQALLAIVGGRTNVEEEIDESAISTTEQATKAVEDSSRLARGNEKVVNASGDAKELPEETAKADEKPKRKPRIVPDVVIPEHLQSNALLRLLKRQVVALVKDMDDSPDDETGEQPKKAKVLT